MILQSIEINNNSVHFIPVNELPLKKIDYTLPFDKNNILLINNINPERLSILNDKNISIKNLPFCESYLKLELNSKIIFN